MIKEMPGEFSKLLLQTAVMLVHCALYSDQLEVDASLAVPSITTEKRRKHKAQPKVVTVKEQVPRQTTLVQGVQRAVRRAIGTVQYQEAEEVPASSREDTISSQVRLCERLPLRLVRVKTYSLRAEAKSFEELRVS